MRQFISMAIVLAAATPVVAQQVQPLRQAHAHNDYLHDRPLLDALDQGFCNVEADVFLVDGELLVGHTVAELRPDRTLQTLYLRPLMERVKKNHGQVFPGGPEFTLMIDFKSAAEPTYAALKKILGDYREILSSFRDGQVNRRAVTIVISGNRPVETIRHESERFAFLDGRTSDLDSTISPSVMPWISDSWSKLFRWNGQGEMPGAEKEKLQAIVEQAHRNSQRVRFWGAPDREATWKVLTDAGVDLINTDRLPELAAFLRQR